VQGVKLILIHFNKLCDEIRSKEALVDKFKTFNIIVFEVAFRQLMTFLAH